MIEASRSDVLVAAGVVVCRHADIAPCVPIDREGPGSRAHLVAVGKAVEKSPARRVVDRADPSHHGAKGGKNDEEIERGRCEDRLEHAGPLHFRRQDLPAFGRGAQLDEPTPGNSRRMNHTVDTSEALPRPIHDTRHGFLIRNVGTHRENLRSFGLQLEDLPDLAGHRIRRPAHGERIVPLAAAL